MLMKGHCGSGYTAVGGLPTRCMRTDAADTQPALAPCAQMLRVRLSRISLPGPSVLGRLVRRNGSNEKANLVVYLTVPGTDILPMQVRHPSELLSVMTLPI